VAIVYCNTVVPEEQPAVTYIGAVRVIVQLPPAVEPEAFAIVNGIPLKPGSFKMSPPWGPR
jgi:hypothetical protein